MADVPQTSTAPVRQGRRKFVSARVEQRRPEIPLAPLIDVLLFLILFFAAASTLEKDLGMEVSRPEATTGTEQPADALAVVISAQGEIRFEGHAVDLPGLQETIKSRLRSRPQLAIVIVADRATRTERVIAVMDRCRLAGARRVTLATERPKR